MNCRSRVRGTHGVKNADTQSWSSGLPRPVARGSCAHIYSSPSHTSNGFLHSFIVYLLWSVFKRDRRFNYVNMCMSTSWQGCRKVKHVELDPGLRSRLNGGKLYSMAAHRSALILTASPPTPLTLLLPTRIGRALSVLLSLKFKLLFKFTHQKLRRTKSSFILFYSMKLLSLGEFFYRHSVKFSC